MSNSFEDDYPQFLQALTHYAYPGDARRFREAHNEWRARPVSTRRSIRRTRGAPSTALTPWLAKPVGL